MNFGKEKNMVNKKFWATTFTLTGTIIGAGILGLPYVFAKSGFLIGFAWLIFLGLIMIITKLYLGEVVLSTSGKHQLTGYAKKYLGKKGEKIMLLTMLFGIYSALLAYLIGEGESLSQLFSGSTNYAIFFAIGFWLIMTFLLRKELEGLKKVETWGVLGIIAIIVGIFIYFLPSLSLSNITQINTSFTFFPIGVILFALLGFVTIPELKLEIKNQESKLKKAIIIGVLIPMILYTLFTLVFVGVLGPQVPQVATLALGRIVTILGIFTMLTSYFVLSFSIKDMYKFDYKLSKSKIFFLVSALPLILYILIQKFNLAGFVKILGIGGVVSAGLTGILILFMNKKAKKQGNRKPEYRIPINWFIIILISLIFIAGVIFEFFF